MTPEQMLAKTTAMAGAMNDIASKSVFVGLPRDKVGGQVYGGGAPVILIGATHEYGSPEKGIPQRSFLRLPFRVNRGTINVAIAKQFRHVALGRKSPEAGLNTIGAIATNYSKGAFTSQGYGEWPDIQESTKERKGSSRVLIDTRVLSGSITWVVR